MGRILAIDYGKKRTGLAVSDALQLIAGGLTTVSTAELLDYIVRYCEREPVETFVIGLPKQTNGLPSENEARVRQFAAVLRKKFPTTPVEFCDERFTSVLAHQTMLDAGLGKKARRDKALVDEISATIILQSYMESRRFRLQT